MPDDAQPTNSRGGASSAPDVREIIELLEKCPDIVARLDAGLRCTFVNPAVERSLGRPRSDFIGKTPAEAGLLRLHEYVLLALRTGQYRCEDVPVSVPSGELEFEIHINVERAPGGGVQAIFLVARDVTERRRLERALRENERQFRMVLANSPVTVSTSDGELRYTWIFNPYPVFAGAQVLGRRDDELAPEAEVRELVALKRSVLEQNAGRRAEIRIGAGENARWYDAIAEPARDDSGAAVGVRVAATDISDRKRVEEALRESEAQHRLLAEAAPQMILTKSPDGTAEFVNRAWTEFSGLSAEETARAGLFALMHPDDRPRALAELDKAIERKEPFQIECRMQRRDKRYVWVLAWGAPVKSREGEVVKWITTMQDIEERKQAQERMAHARRMETIGVLAAGIAHDFNNLLTGVLGNASLALESAPPGDPNRRFLNAILTHGERAAELTRQMLAFAGKGRFILRPVDLAAAARTALDAVRRTISPAIQVREDYAPGTPVIEGDAEQIEQMVKNLIVNAAEALDDNPGEMLVRTRPVLVDGDHLRQTKLAIQPGDYAGLEVHDTGPGMDRATVERIFEPFFSTRFPGRGLGLAAVQGIAHGHRGATLVRTAPGVGTRFCVLLPAREQAACRACMAGDGARGQETVLVVDEDDDAREVAREALARYGYRTLAAHGKSDGIDLFRQNPGDVAVILLGVGEDHHAAEETLLGLKTVSENVPVLISSAHSEPGTRRRFSRHYVAGFIQKPYAAAALARHVRAAIEQRSV